MTTDRDRVNAALDAWFSEGDWRTRNVTFQEKMFRALAAAAADAPPPAPADTGGGDAAERLAIKRVGERVGELLASAFKRIGKLEAEVERLTRERDEARAEVEVYGALRALDDSDPAGQEPKP